MQTLRPPLLHINAKGVLLRCDALITRKDLNGGLAGQIMEGIQAMKCIMPVPMADPAEGRYVPALSTLLLSIGLEPLVLLCHDNTEAKLCREDAPHSGRRE
eukprot:jgi/Tetstr1/462587/TSEL_007573.t1